MPRGWRQVGSDLKNRRHVDAYSIAFVTFVLAVLSLVPDIVPDELRWAALLAGVGILVWRITIPKSQVSTLDDLLENRFAFDRAPLSERLKNVTEVCIFAPSAVNFLSAHNCELLRTEVLSKPNGIVRVVILNPANEPAIQLAARQLDDSLDYPIQDFQPCLQDTIRQLRVMTSWNLKGSFSYRLLDYNPGFSLVSFNPTNRNGRAIVEFHAFHNESTSSRMHIEISRQQSDHWYAYWTNQFNRIWDASLPPHEGSHSSSSG